MSPTGQHPLVPKTEAAYLAQQAVAAKAAMTHTVRDIGRGVQQVAVEHPLLMLGLAGVTGALAARAFLPAAPPAHNGEHEPARPPSLLSDVLADTVKPLVQNLSAAVVAMVCEPAVEAKPRQAP